MSKETEVKYNRNGYEIRSDILAMAKQFVENEYYAAYQRWEVLCKKDEKGNVIDEGDFPEFPTIDDVLETAELMYSFVNNSPKFNR